MMSRRKVRIVKGAILMLGLFALSCLTSRNDKLLETSHSDTLEEYIHYGSSRQLLALPNCTPRAIEHFPQTVFNHEQRKSGAIILFIIATIYMFMGFALVCDDYFVPALEEICDVFHIESDVAGATFMAAGSSAPELATSVVAVFIAKDDIGVGTVVGSAVFNIMFVISVCALVAGAAVHLNWWPLFRDCIFYTISVTALAVVIIDENVYWYEALSFLVLYGLYILLMYFNSRLEAWIVPKCHWCKLPMRQDEPESIVLYDKLRDSSNLQTNGSISGEIEGETVNKEEPESVFAFPSVWWKRVLFISCLPLKILLYLTIPDCRRPRWKKFFIITFIMSLVWLSLYSYLMVWMITLIGYTLNIPDTIMGLTFVAFGVSLPDVITSVIVVRDGYGDMAVSNAVGSNVFDILICLGLPWLLQSIMNHGDPVQVFSGGLLYATLTLLTTVVFLLAATHINGWKLTKKYGIVLMVAYVFCTVLTSLYELNLFGYVHPKECEISY
ncbi:hypothetical protein CHS0354_004456 [Potamilus streckersoni]|uniref:Sodium/calcium exchanger membrane region domain-containing protein n=1 Tax=Potamilus streckersoni TaxID=2493646 RepID=A0AAE0VZV2_9BIVA|nr:hypothetical protein CHS0354_004456 [Potamilus streckersoni]